MLVDLYEQGRLPLDKFVTERIALDQIEHAFKQYRSNADGRRVNCCSPAAHFLALRLSSLER
jgi:Zn-dependent alcohol dehydrogenase